MGKVNLQYMKFITLRKEGENEEAAANIYCKQYPNLGILAS